jgi:HlyD family secretion protein
MVFVQAVRIGCALTSALVLLPMLSGCGTERSEIVTVAKGSVTSGPSASGTLQYVTEQKIGFPEGGKLTAINVKVGQRVDVGQPVAVLENTEQRNALRKAQDQARLEQVKLDQILAGNRVSTTHQETEDFERQLADALSFRQEVDERNQDAIKRFEKKLDFDQDEVDRFTRRLNTDRDCLRQHSDPVLPGNQGPDQACIDRVRADRDALKVANAQVLQDRADLENAENTKETERLDRQVVIDEKLHDRNLARNNTDFEKTDKPFSVEAQRLAADAAQADLATAQKAFQDTIKPSMYSGTVDHVNGQVGQVLVASYSLLGPGGGPAKGPAKGPAGSDLIVLKDVDAYQVVVPFSQADGSRITPDKSINVTFDEIPGLTSPARIASIEPPAADAKTKNYLVTAVLNQNDPRLKDGMHAKVDVALDRVDDTLAVPADAVQINGRTGMVTLEQPDGTRRDVSVELGMVGSRTIEILSGLRENDKVVAKPATTSR